MVMGFWQLLDAEKGKAGVTDLIEYAMDVCGAT